MSWGAGTPCLPYAVPSSALLAPSLCSPRGVPPHPPTPGCLGEAELLLKVPGFLVGGFVSDPLTDRLVTHRGCAVMT